jgi:hypothetical protein
VFLPCFFQSLRGSSEPTHEPTDVFSSPVQAQTVEEGKSNFTQESFDFKMRDRSCNSIFMKESTLSIWAI